LKKIQIPPILVMIIIGCIARNYFGDVMKPFNNKWAQWLRTCCLGIILTRGGMNITFRGKGIIVALMALVPICCEAAAIAVASLIVFGMPIEVGFSLGFAVAPVAAAIIVPLLMKWDS
jgi:NhaP-type Na+/H+ or K+/H+ antiporter